MDSKKLTRKELYDLVWSKPLTQLAKEFNYSDNGIRKICKKHNIPLPKAGYWSKVKFNKKVQKARLAKHDDSIEIELYIREKENTKVLHPNSLRSKIRKGIENDKKLSFTIPDKISRADPLIVNARKDLKKNKPSDWGTSKGLISTSSDILNLEVSKSNISRALRFMDALIKLLKKRGHSVHVDGWKTYVQVNDEKLKVRMREFVKRTTTTNSSWKNYDYQPSGELSFRIESYRERIWRDSKTYPLETKLLDILTGIELRAEQMKEERIQQEIWQKEREKQEKKVREQKEKKDNELRMFKELFSSATRWHKTQYIRNYIKEFESYNLKNNDLNKEKKQWIEWAREKADWYDPFIEKEVELLNEIDRETLDRKRRYYF